MRTLGLYRRILAGGPALWALVAALAMIGSLLEGVALVILAETITLESAGSLQPDNAIARGVAEVLGWLGLSASVQVLLTGFALVALLSAVFTFMSNVTTHAICARTERRMRERLFTALIDVDWITLTSQRSGEVLKSLNADPEKVTLGIRSLLLAVSSAASATVYLAAASAVSPLLTLVMGGFVLLLWPFHLLAVRYNARVSSLMHGLERGLFNRAAHALSDAKAIFSQGLRDFVRRDYLVTLRDYAGAAFRKDASLETARLIYELLAVLFIGFLLWVTIGLGGRLSNALVVLAIFYRMAPKIIYLQDSVYRTLNQSEWVRQWLELCDGLSGAARPRGSGRQVAFERRLELRDVVFGYPDRPEAVLSQVSLHLDPGECVAVTGVSGSGKTTLIDLLTGLCRPQSGEVLLDGISLESVDPQGWQRQIGLVLQNPALFYGSVEENVAYGLPVNRAEVEEALRRAGLEDFVRSLPRGLETPVGEMGVQLSGGQRQRLAIARAFYRKPRFLILDEATSALDQENHAWIARMVEEHKGRAAILIVAHGGQLLELADRAYVLENGRLRSEPRP